MTFRFRFSNVHKHPLRRINKSLSYAPQHSTIKQSDKWNIWSLRVVESVVQQRSDHGTADLVIGVLLSGVFSVHNNNNNNHLLRVSHTQTDILERLVVEAVLYHASYLYIKLIHVCVYIQYTVYTTAKWMFWWNVYCYTFIILWTNIKNSNQKHTTSKVFLATLNNSEGTNTYIVFLSSHCMIDFCAYVQYKRHQPATLLFLLFLPSLALIFLLPFHTSFLLHAPFFLSLSPAFSPLHLSLLLFLLLCSW